MIVNKDCREYYRVWGKGVGSKYQLKQIIILSECGSALYPDPVIYSPAFSAVKITPSESLCASLRKMIKIGAFSPIRY
jgi:hypothetical protein